MIIQVQEVVSHVNQLLKYGETIAPTEQHARLITRWHNFKDQQFTIEKVEDGWLIQVTK